MTQTSHRDAIVVKDCEFCKQPFEVTWYKRNRQRFCSKGCVNRARAQESRTIACAQCGKGFTVPWSLRTRTHCSQRCANIRPRDDYAEPRYSPRECEACGETYRPGSAAARWCKTCVPDKQAYQRMLKYGVSYPRWIAMLDRYDGMCWVCRTRLAVSLDHDHVTGRPRGVTCQKCNVALHYAENAEWLVRAARYLEGGDAHGFE